MHRAKGNTEGHRPGLRHKDLRERDAEGQERDRHPDPPRPPQHRQHLRDHRRGKQHHPGPRVHVGRVALHPGRPEDKVHREPGQVPISLTP